MVGRSRRQVVEQRRKAADERHRVHQTLDVFRLRAVRVNVLKAAQHHVSTKTRLLLLTTTKQRQNTITPK